MNCGNLPSHLCFIASFAICPPKKHHENRGGPGSVNIMVIFEKGFETIHFGALKFEAARNQEVQ